MHRPSSLSILLTAFLLGGLAAGSYLLLRSTIETETDLDRILKQPPPTAGRTAITSDVIASPEMDQVALALLRDLPKNNTRRSEHVGYLYRDKASGRIMASEPRMVITRFKGQVAYASITLPSGLDILAVYHDHFRNTKPGPGHGDAGPLYRGMVSYLRDYQGNIFKIEYSEAWKNEHNNFNGWKLATLRGERLQGQGQWRPGAILSLVER